MMKRAISNWLLKHLFNAVTQADIIGNDPRTKEMTIDGIKVKEDELRAMAAEIKALEGFRIWSVLMNTTKKHAEDRIFNKSVTIDDVVFGKAMLYNLSLQQSVISAIKSKNPQ